MRKPWLIIVYLAIALALALALSTMFTSTPAATAFDSPLPKPAGFLPQVVKQQETAGSPHNLPGDQVFSEGSPAP
jgi:hypothetical protein